MSIQRSRRAACSLLESGRAAVPVLVLAVCASLVADGRALADTIYLQNGRVIRTSKHVIDGNRVVFEQYGNLAAIPLALVDRIVEDDLSGPERTVAPVPSPSGARAGTGRVAGGAATVAAAPARSADQVVPEGTREFWQDRVRAIYDEQDQLELEFYQLRREEAAFLFSHRSTFYTRERIAEVQGRLAELERALPELRREAKSAGAPVGWLRLPYMEERARRGSARQENLYDRYRRLRGEPRQSGQ